jgi:hypothetical protein
VLRTTSKAICVIAERGVLPRGKTADYVLTILNVLPKKAAE